MLTAFPVRATALACQAHGLLKGPKTLHHIPTILYVKLKISYTQTQVNAQDHLIYKSNRCSVP